MLWQDMPSEALRRIRSARAGQAGATPDTGGFPDRQVLNILGALQLLNRTLQLYPGAAAHPLTVRIAELDAAQRRLQLALSNPASDVAPVAADSAASLVGELGSVRVLMPCRIVGDTRLGDGARIATELPCDALYVQVRCKSRVPVPPGLDAWLELPATGDCGPRRFRISDLGEDGVGFVAETASADGPTEREFLADAVLHLPAGRLIASSIEVMHVRTALGARHAGGRFRLPGGRARALLNRWLDRCRAECAALVPTSAAR